MASTNIFYISNRKRKTQEKMNIKIMQGSMNKIFIQPAVNQINQHYSTLYQINEINLQPNKCCYNTIIFHV